MDDNLSKPVRIGELKSILEATSKIGPPDRPSRKSGSDLPVCDERQWNELLAIDDSEEFVNTIFQSFIGQAEQLASRLPELAEDPEVLASEAHKLRSSAAYVGAVRAASICGIVENAANISLPTLDQRAVTDFKKALTVSADDYRKRLKRQ